MGKYSVEISGRTIPLRYTMRELADMEEAIGTMDNFRDLILKGKKRLRNMAAAIRIMGNSALEKAGKNGVLTDEQHAALYPALKDVWYISVRVRSICAVSCIRLSCRRQ